MTEQEREKCRINKQFFMKYWKEIENRPGANDFLEWLEFCTDYFTAPASRKYHGAHPGGLLVHSINVCEEMLVLLDTHAAQKHLRQSAILVSLLHDVCKCNFYKPTGDGYTIHDDIPLGHGEKSLYLIMENGLLLNREEAAAIRWHMGAYGDPDKLQNLGQAFERWPLALFLHLADMIAAHYIETED